MKYFHCLILIVLYSGIVSVKYPITIYLAGDSTMAPKLPDKRPETGWGELLQGFFDAEKVRIENHAKNGRSTRSFIAESLWQGIIEKLEKGDYVFIQFGHNDQSKEKVERYTSPDDYRRNLIRFIHEVREKKAVPVLLTPVMRRRFDKEGRFQDSHGVDPDIVRTVSVENDVPLIDMHRKSEQVIRRCGVEGLRSLFLQLKPSENANYPNGVTDDTHFGPRGAEVMAGLAVEGIRESKLGLAKSLIEARDVSSPCSPSAARRSIKLVKPLTQLYLSIGFIGQIN